MSPAHRPRVLLADDHLLVAEALKSLLSAEFDLVGVVEDGRALIEEARRLRPDVIVADVTMPHLMASTPWCGCGRKATACPSCF